VNNNGAVHTFNSNTYTYEVVVPHLQWEMNPVWERRQQDDLHRKARSANRRKRIAKLRGRA
jgi:hypothetical protein